MSQQYSYFNDAPGTIDFFRLKCLGMCVTVSVCVGWGCGGLKTSEKVLNLTLDNLEKHCLNLIQELPGLLVEDPLGDVYKTPTREEVSRKYHQVVTFTLGKPY